MTTTFRNITPSSAITIITTTLLSVTAALTSCNSKKTDSNEMERMESTINETFVDTMTLRSSTFNKQVVCNGHLKAKTKSDLNFLRTGLTTHVYVKEGQHVSKGTLIASTDKTERTRELEKAQHELERARVALIDKLIGLGYDADMKEVPAEVMKRAEVSSGYYSAKYELQSARTALKECDLFAPFAGRIANLDGRTYQNNEKICTLIDDSQFDVEFKVLEAELPNISIGQKVKVSPFIDESLTCTGIVREINPLVDEKGLVKITGRISGHNSKLIDGMNVRIVVEQQVRNMFVVPKDAVVERDGYHVVFLYRDGKAVWTYVDVIHSNISSFAITGCSRKETTVKAGDIVITSGNLNLADGTEVRLN